MSTARVHVAVIVLGLVFAVPAAQAQGLPGGGRGNGSRGGAPSGRAGRGGGGSSADRPPPPPNIKQVAASQIDIVGVVKEIGPNGRVTIDYEEAPALDLPAGSRSFEVAKTSLLKGVTVGEHVRFRLDSQQVSLLEAYAGGGGKLSDGPSAVDQAGAPAGTTGADDSRGRASSR